MTFVEDENKPYKYIMSVIDCFSKYGWAYPIVNKKPETIIEVLKTIFKTRVPECLWVDKGTEFYNSKVKSFLSAHGVELYSTFGEHKSAIVERFNRTIKQKMWKIFTEDDTRKYIKLLPVIVKIYNNTKHRTTKFTPIDASEQENSDEVLLNIQKSRISKITCR